MEERDGGPSPPAPRPLCRSWNRWIQHCALCFHSIFSLRIGRKTTR